MAKSARGLKGPAGLNPSDGSDRSDMSDTSLPSKLLSIFACPGDVFEEVAASPPRLANWLLPTLLVGVASLLLVAAQASAVSGHVDRFSAVAVWVGAFAGTFWSALLLWFIGRVFLKTRFSYWKALEVAGLTGTIVVLGAIVTVL